LSLLVAYRPFLDPIPMADGVWWLTIVPMALLISVAYKAVRKPTMERFWRSAFSMATQIVVFVALAGLGVHALVEWIVPAFGG
jgi:hypothetical protein